MAANPASAGAVGLAVAESGAGMGGASEPLDDVRSIFTTLGMTIIHLDGMTNAYNLMVMDNFGYIRVDDAGSFVKVWNETSQAVATKSGMTPQ